MSRQILDEDLQIMRCTLAAISDDVRRYSDESADALVEAAAKLEIAQREFSRRAWIDESR